MTRSLAKEFKAFFVRKQIFPVDKGAQALWFTLLYLNGQGEWITVKSDVLEAHSGLSRPAVIRARKNLAEQGYIEFKEGIGNGLTAYKLLVLRNVTQNGQTVLQNVTQNVTQNSRFALQNVTQNVTQGETQAESGENQDKYKEYINYNIYNKNNKKDLLNNNIYSSSSIISSSAVKKIADEIEGNVCQVTSMVLSDIEMFLADADEDLIMFAVREAHDNNAKNWNYVKAIIRNLLREGVKTGAEARRRKEEYIKQKKDAAEKKAAGKSGKVGKKFSDYSLKSSYDYEAIEQRALMLGKE